MNGELHFTVHLSVLLQKCEGEDKDKKKEIVVLEMKRSQAINIGLTKLPPIRALKQAILGMDSAVIDREGIDVSVSVIRVVAFTFLVTCEEVTLCDNCVTKEEL